MWSICSWLGRDTLTAFLLLLLHALQGSLTVSLGRLGLLARVSATAAVADAFDEPDEGDDNSNQGNEDRERDKTNIEDQSDDEACHAETHCHDYSTVSAHCTACSDRAGEWTVKDQPEWVEQDAQQNH